MSTRTKMFCGCPNDVFGKPPNTAICPVCSGHPGSLPVPNTEALQKAACTARALGCGLSSRSHFDRKNYFYPDLPSGFQVSQYKLPLGGESEQGVPFLFRGKEKWCKITRLHLENDAGKLIHRGDRSLCDYNRAGVPLMEIVTEPDLRSPEEARAFAEELRLILITVGASKADMYKGMMRFDASISLRPSGEATLSPRSEIKNLNSFESLEAALSYEQGRLTKDWEQHGPTRDQVTVGWVAEEGKAEVLREKETAADYRYFPEPDIPPLEFSADFLRALDVSIPPLPHALRAHYTNLGWGFTPPNVEQLLGDRELRARIDEVIERVTPSRETPVHLAMAGKLLMNPFIGFLKEAGKTAGEGPSADHLVELLGKISGGVLSSNQGKQVLEQMVRSGKSAAQIIEEGGWSESLGEEELRAVVSCAVVENAKAVADFRGGKAAALAAVVGWVMKQTRGQADPVVVKRILSEILASGG